MAIFYFATNGQAWTAADNWLSYAHHECDWESRESFELSQTSDFIDRPSFGVRCPRKNLTYNPICNNHDEYQHIWLAHNNVDWALPEELFWLTSLRSISLFRNTLDGALSSHIGKLTRYVYDLCFVSLL